MRPLDPRLLRHASAARRYVVLTAVVGTLTAAAVIGQAVLLAGVIAGVFAGEPVSTQSRPLVLFGLLVLARTALAWVQARFGHRAATTVVAQLRRAALDRLAATEPFQHPGTGSVATTTLLTRGLDVLDGYFVTYLPQLLLVGTVTPAVLLVIWWNDTIAGLTVLLTLPLVPLFMALVGLSTQAHADRRLRTLQRLGAQVLDLIAGLPTLRAFGRARAQTSRVRAAGESYRRATMRTLVSAFLSALVLETLTTLCVALVAVGVGLRLVDGTLDLRTGLIVLILAPEVYLPLRMVGVHFHASADGLAAGGQVFEILERPVPAHGTLPAPDLRTTVLRVEAVRFVHASGRAAPDDVHAVIHPGEVIAVTGPSGVGKSTLVSVLLGLRRPTSGSVTLERLADDGSAGPPVRTDLAAIDPESWWAQLAWVPQQPRLVPGTIGDNVRAGCPGATAEQVREAARATGLADVVHGLPEGLETQVGRDGAGLSAGQRQRVAVTRALLKGARLVILDEPTAHLDAAADAVISDAVGALRAAGRTVVLVTHRESLLALADRVIRIRAEDPYSTAVDSTAVDRTAVDRTGQPSSRLVAPGVPA